jgi:hypothetical protein
MKCRDEAKEILLEILGRGLLRIRAFGWAGRHQECAIEADHLDNFPRANIDGTVLPLSFYYNVARPVFIKEATSTEEFEPCWNRLKALLVELDDGLE